MGRIYAMRPYNSPLILCEPGVTLSVNSTKGLMTKRWNSVSSPFSQRSIEKSQSHRARSDQSVYFYEVVYKLTGLGRNLKKLISWRCVGKETLTCKTSSSVVDDQSLSSTTYITVGFECLKASSATSLVRCLVVYYGTIAALLVFSKVGSFIRSEKLSSWDVHRQD